ncbi:MAG: hypothetical protein Q9179_005289 [Wetmoreana sp. 5 TL-2023]
MARTSKADIRKKAMLLQEGPRNSIESHYPNEKLRHIITAKAEAICLYSAPGIDRSRIRMALMVNLNAEWVIVDDVVNDALNDPKQPYGRCRRDAVLGNEVTARMVVEILGKHLEKRILEGQTRFLLDGFPENELQAAIFEEDVALIRAFIYIDGQGPASISKDYYLEAGESIRPVVEKLEAIDITNRDAGEKLNKIVDEINSIGYLARLMIAGDIFTPSAPGNTVP